MIKVPPDGVQERKRNLRSFIIKRIEAIDASWFPARDEDGYYCWTKARWIDVMYRSVDLMTKEGIPPHDQLQELCWLASADKLQVSAGSASCKPILYNCSYVLWNTSSRDEMRSRQEEGKPNKRKADARHVSHRCAINACWNPHHLVLEDADTNEDRKGCRYGALELCPHQPKCIFKHRCNLVITQKN